MQVVCPHCNRELEAPDRMAGNLVTCPTCQGTMELPTLEVIGRPVRRTHTGPGTRPPRQRVGRRSFTTASGAGRQPDSGRRPRQQPISTPAGTNPAVYAFIGLAIVAVPLLYLLMGSEKDAIVGTWTIDIDASMDGLALWLEKNPGKSRQKEQVARAALHEAFRRTEFEVKVDNNFAAVSFVNPQLNNLKLTLSYVRENLGGNRYKFTGTMPDGTVDVLYAWFQGERVCFSDRLGGYAMVFRRR